MKQKQHCNNHVFWECFVIFSLIILVISSLFFLSGCSCEPIPELEDKYNLSIVYINYTDPALCKRDCKADAEDLNCSNFLEEDCLCKLFGCDYYIPSTTRGCEDGN